MDRRSFLTGAAIVVATPAAAALDPGAPMLRSTLDAAELGVSPKRTNDQSRGLQQLLNLASDDDREVFLPAGTYMIKQMKLPARVRLSGVPGATRLVFGGGEFMMAGEHCERIALSGLTIDGAGLALADHVPGLVHIAETHDVTVENCTIEGSTRAGLALDRCGGRVTRTTIRNASDAGVRALESATLSLTDNTIEDCGNGGILVHRWAPGEDGTIVTGNRIRGISLADVGDGPNGCGISVFRADRVMVSNNQVADCASHAIRVRSASNVQITGNSCSEARKAGVGAEAAVGGVVIANNIVSKTPMGISLATPGEGSRIAVISGNLVRDVTAAEGQADDGSAGIGIAAESDAALTGNVVEAAARVGIRIGWGPSLKDVAATGNVVRGAPVGIAVSVAEGAGAAVISDNLIAGAADGAILAMRWSARVSGDLARTGAGSYPQLTVERNRTG